MEVPLEVIVSTSIKWKKPCPRICWLGQEKESVFLLDEKHFRELNLHSGRLKKAAPRLQALLKKKNIVTLSTSLNGVWLAGLLLSGELFIWNKDLDSLQTIPANEEISQIVTTAQETFVKLFLCVSGDGNRVLLVSHVGCIYLWESSVNKNAPVPPKSPPLDGRWTKIQPQSSTLLPSMEDKESAVHASFVKNEVLGDCCLCTFAFYSGDRLVFTFLTLRWYEHNEVYNSTLPYHIHWAQQDCSLNTLVPSCEIVKSRGALLASFSRDGLTLAVSVNQKDPKATQVLFINTMNFVTVTGHLKGCSSKEQPIPSRFIRSYWVGDLAWTADSLFLACVLKRGALVLLTRLGELLTLTTFGCSVEFGPAEFIPLHPLITIRPPMSTFNSHDANDSFGSTSSDTDVMRQRYSVTSHPRLPYLMVSDGYMVTTLRFTKNLSPSSFMKSLLLESAQKLEIIRQRLQLSKPKAYGIKLRSLASLKAGLLKEKGNTYSTISTVPSFLQVEEDACDTKDHQDEDEDSDNQEFAKSSVPSEISFVRAEEGRLEFAYMFDTIHAGDDYDGVSDMCHEMRQIQKALLTAWGVGVTTRNLVEKDTLLNYTVGCLTHFLSILRILESCTATQKKTKDRSCFLFFTIFQQCLTVLYWDVAPRLAVRHMIKLTSETIKLILVQPQPLYLQNVMESVCLLKMVSRHLNSIYMLHFEPLPFSSEINSGVYLDSMKTPVFLAQISFSPKHWSVHNIFKQPPGPVNLIRGSEKRLAVIWRLLYNQTLLYQARLRQHICSNRKLLPQQNSHEDQAIRSLLYHIQAELQSAGEQLEQSLNLMPVNGEEFFLLGSYKESMEFWKKALMESTAKGGRRTSLLQTRYYLAVLYCHLYNYNLNDSQGMCDQLVRELLRRSNLLSDTMQGIPDLEFPTTRGFTSSDGSVQMLRSSESDHLQLKDVHHEALLAVIKSMGRFMAAYFTNKLLFVFPPHNVGILPPLHLASGKCPRVVSLKHSVVASVIREQNLSSVWTVEYALDLLLVGGLVPEAAWLANKLGDWKMSISMGVAYNLSVRNNLEALKLTELQLPLDLTPTHILLEKLQSFLGSPPSSEILNKDCSGQKQFTDPIEEEDADLLFSSMQEMLKAAVMADAEVFTETFRQLMESAKELSRKLTGLVPERLYLPAPPLYCPQPSSVSEDDSNDLHLASEKLHRQKLSGVLQRILLLLRAARCSLPAAQWYIKQIKRARKIMQKIRVKGSLPPLNMLPETLLNYANSSTSFFKSRLSGVPQSDQVSSSVLAYFRELCALCWMLHVRERLSFSCRQYQKARDNGKLFKGAEEYDSCVTEHCFNALEWACRMLPFTRAANCEELIQDVILSLVSELPPVRKVAEVLVKAFPRPEDVRVPLREKYQALHQRLRHSVVKGPDGAEMMSVIIHNVHRQRVKALRRVQRNIGPLEMHLWEPALGDAYDDDSYYDRLSLGTSLSRSTLTDFGKPYFYSEGDTLSEALMNDVIDESSEWHVVETKCSQKSKEDKTVCKNGGQKSKDSTENKPALPIVGTWEFESDDEEYTNFLNLFLSYLLERDLLHYSETSIPFLTVFSRNLQEHELNSLVFDVHTALKRKLGRPKIQSVFRAGCCYTGNEEFCSESGKLEGTLAHNQSTTDLVTNPALPLVIEKPVASSFKYFSNIKTRNLSKSGLYGLKEQRTQKVNEEFHKVSSVPPECGLPTASQYRYRRIQTTDCMPSEELGAQLQAKFSNEAKLVEWMIRWSEKRLFWSAGKAELYQAQSTAIRVKASSAAILTSLWLLEKPYLGGVRENKGRFAVPSSEYTVATVLQPVTESMINNNSGKDIEDSEVGSVAYVEVHIQEPQQDIASEAASSHSGGSEHRSIGRQLPALDEQSMSYSVATEDRCNTIVEQYLTASETEDDLEDAEEDTQRSPNIFVSIQPISNQVENLSSEVTINNEDSHKPLIQKTMQQPRNNVAAEAPFINPPAQVFGSTANVPVVVPCVQESHGEQVSQPSNTSETVRQLFQDEMFRLLQLQQINFMSLMQVVGSSFAALPAMQQILQQSSQVIVNQQGNPVAVPTPLPLQTALNAQNPIRDTSPNTEGHASTKKNRASSTETRPMYDQNNKENIQNPPGLRVSLNEAKDGETISATNSLLTTAPSYGLPIIHTSPVVQKTPFLLPSNNMWSNCNGFPLLQLQPEPKFTSMNIIPRNMTPHLTKSRAPKIPREAWGPINNDPNIPSAHNLRNHSKDSYCEALNKNDVKEERKMWAEPSAKGALKHSQKHSPVFCYIEQKNVPVHLQNSNTQESRPSHQTLPGTHHYASGIPLLHLQSHPVPHIPSVFSSDVKVPVSASQSNTKPEHFPLLPNAALTLLKAKLPQQMPNIPFGSTPKLIPLQNLIAFEQSLRTKSLRGTAEGALQLLKANIEPFEEVKPMDSIKRQKRRTHIQKQENSTERKERKSSVTFRPEDSIINPNNFDEIIQIETKKHDDPELQKNNDFAIPIGTFESLLSENNPEAPVTSIAMLHYLASTKKKAPEIRDACTNTDTANEASKSYKNTGTACEEVLPDIPSSGLSAAPQSASDTASSVIPQLLPPDIYLNLRFLGKDLDEIKGPSQSSVIPTSQVGHHYINVIDIDAEDILKDLPDPAAPKIINQRVPSSAELHHLAASVTNAVPLKPGKITDSISARPRLEAQEVRAADPVTYNLLLGGAAELVSRPTAARGADHTFSWLQDMDVQLAALQTMADKMEQDFANTGLLVNTIENLATAMDPSLEDISYSSRDVRVSEKALRMSPRELQDLMEEDLGSPSHSEIHSHDVTRLHAHFSAEINSQGHSLAGIKSQVQSPGGILSWANSPEDQVSFQNPSRHKIPDTASAANDNMGKSLLDDPFHITGLSDIADILGDLMDGGISASELGLTESQAKTLSRERLNKLPLKHARKRSEKDRMELQMWMKRKQREKLAEHKKKMEELREMEHNPFQPNQNANSSMSSKTIMRSQRVKNEKDKTLLAEHHSNRVSDALSLMQEMLSEAKHIPVADPTTISTSSRSPRCVSSSKRFSSPKIRSSSTSQIEKRRSVFRSGLSQPRLMAPPSRLQSRGTETFLFQKGSQDSKTRARSAPSYPVHVKYDPSLPGDRISQITRRGMLSGKNRANVNIKSTKPLPYSSLIHSPSSHQGSRNKQTSFHYDPTEEMEPERDLVSPWEVPNEIKRLINSDGNSNGSQELLFNEDDVSHDYPKPDNSSESTGSILSKLDWNAIEDMVASIENT
ncbi:ciliogenesis and planar polarity effector 1 [Bombina bombina]|uniref:ciliogenesis and planar polarity effector 1 n=1 Tax=Bombina bombina TaxID=8345 RepID=UPI00235ABD5F|nr:ciliogenesis and planar polarity effector 1 [Bombina bombina]